MSLKVTTEAKEERQLTMVIEVDDERFNQEMRKAARKLAGQLRIPGFRKGRAPYHVVVQYVGRGALIEEFVDDLGQQVYREAIEQEELEPYAVASLDEVDLEPLRYTLTVPLQPQITLGAYRDLRVDEPEVEVSEEDVQARVDQILERHAGYEDVERPSEYGDLMTVDVRAVVLDEEGNETETVVLDETDWDITPDEENPMEPAGFDEALLGLSPGDDSTFEIAWPEDSQSMYAGERVRFSVHVRGIQAYRVPELSDELAQEAGPDYETADDLVESIRESLREEASSEAESSYFETVVDALVEMSELDYPPAAVEMQIDQMLRSMDMEMRQMGLQGVNHYLQLTNQSLDTYRDEVREQAEEQLRRNLVLAEMVRAEQLWVSDEEVKARLEEMLGEENEDASEEEKESRAQILKMMSEGPNRQMIEDQVLGQKGVERLLAIARGEEVPEPGADRPPAQSEADAEPEEDGAEMTASVNPEEDGGEADAEPVAAQEASGEAEVVTDPAAGGSDGIEEEQG